MSLVRPAPPRAIYVSPHADDWIFFRGEQAFADLRSANVALILVTAGDAGLTTGYWEAREQGVLEAVASACPATFEPGRVRVNGHEITRYRYQTGSVYCLRIRDGHLRNLLGSSVGTVDESTNYRSLMDLSQTLEGIISTETATGPRPWINSPIYRSDYGFNPRDHPDHTATGKAVRRFAGWVGHRTWWWGYTTRDLPCLIVDAVRLANKRRLFEVYRGCLERRFEELGSPQDWRYWLNPLQLEWDDWGPKSCSDSVSYGEPDPY